MAISSYWSYLKVEENILGSFFKGGEGTTEPMSCHLSFLIYSSITDILSSFSPNEYNLICLRCTFWFRNLFWFCQISFLFEQWIQSCLAELLSYLASFVTFILLLEHILLCPIGGSISKVSVPLQVVLFLLICVRNSSWFCCKQGNDVTQYLHCFWWCCLFACSCV